MDPMKMHHCLLGWPGFDLQKWSRLAALTFSLVLAATLKAADYVNVQGGSWFNPATWSPEAYPLTGDNVTITNASISLTFSNALHLQLNNLSMSNSMLDLSDNSGLGTFALAGSASHWTNSSFQGAMLQSGTLVMAGNNSFGNGTMVTNQGTMRQTGSGTLSTFLTTLINLSPGTYDLDGDGTMVDAYGGLGGDDLFNAGTLRKSSGTNTATILIRFINQGGSIEVDSGILSLADASDCSNATIHVATGAALDLTGGHDGYWSGTMTGSGGGHVLLRSGNLYASPALMLDFPDDVFSWTDGNLNGTVTNLGTMTLSGTNNVFASTLFVNAGWFRHTNTASLDLFERTVQNLPGATYDLEDDGSFSGGNFGIWGVFENRGLFRKSGGGGVSMLEGNHFDNYGGTIEVDTGAVQFAYFIQTNGITRLAGGNITGATFYFNGGLLTGSGSVTGNVVNAGATLSPGTGLGTMNIVGNYTQAGSGTLYLTLGGTNAGEFAQLDVSTNAQLAGELAVTLTNGYQPAAGDTFQILSCSNCSGTFQPAAGFPSGISITYSNSGVFLVVTGEVSIPPQISLPQVIGGNFEFNFISVSNQSYTIQQNADLATTNWLNLTNITGDGSRQQFAMPVTNVGQQFFRVRSP